jgi:inner membrane protein
MATAFTHGYVAALLAPLAPKRIPRTPLVVVLVSLAILPDIDVLAFRFGIPYGAPMGHRGFTHSFVFSFAAAVMSACFFYRYTKPFSRGWFVLAMLFFAATASHGILDAFTDAGLGVAFFLPFDATRYFFPWRPLQTSPIGIAAFFRGDASTILVNEFLWVWVPSTVVAFLVGRFRRMSRKA